MMIRVDHVSKSFGSQKVLDDISLEVKEGEILAILGPSGTGKSVFLKVLMGLIKPDTGSVRIGDNDITQLNERQLLELRKNIGFLFQEGALYDFMNVFDNVSFPLREHTRLDKTAIAQRVRKVLSDIDLKGVEAKFPSELSGGMKKRVALARAIILGTKALFCDEPTSGLDPVRSRDISDLISDVSDKLHCTTIITSHDVRNSFRIADRIALIHGGRIMALGTKQELENSNDKVVKEFICN